MNDHICQQIENSAHYRELVDKRQRFAFILSIIMLIIYVGFILLIAFARTGWAPRCTRAPASRAVFRLALA
jgi:uncharacterized membrane protein (DUF485 family)